MWNASTVPDALYLINLAKFCHGGTRDAALEVNLAVCLPRFYPAWRNQHTLLTNVLINAKTRTGNGIASANGLQNLYFST